MGGLLCRIVVCVSLTAAAVSAFLAFIPRVAQCHFAVTLFFLNALLCPRQHVNHGLWEEFVGDHIFVRGVFLGEFFNEILFFKV